MPGAAAAIAEKLAVGRIEGESVQPFAFAAFNSVVKLAIAVLSRSTVWSLTDTGRGNRRFEVSTEEGQPMTDNITPLMMELTKEVSNADQLNVVLLMRRRL